MIGWAATGGLAGCTSNDDGDGSGDGDAVGGGDGSDGGDDTTTDPEEDDAEETATGEPSMAEFVDEAEGQVQLSYGETATLSNGVETTVHGVEVVHGAGDHTPGERDAFALVEVETVNGGDGQATILSHTDPGIYVLYEDRQVDQTFDYGLFSELEQEPYEVNEEVQAGVRREGYILFEVGAGLTEADIDFLWQDRHFVAADLDGEINVRWSSG